MKILKFLPLLLYGLVACNQNKSDDTAQPIDRKALVSRHNVKITEVDTLNSLSVGNGKFAFTADFTGLQTYPDVYDKGMSLGTQSEWGWHYMPTEEVYSLEDVAVEYESCNGHLPKYAIQHKTEGRAKDATNYLRANPHRLHLGIVGFVLFDEEGNELNIDAVKPVAQELNLWTGELVSEFEVQGETVKVQLVADQNSDAIAAKVESSLIAQNRLKIRLKFPYGKECHVCAGYDWGNSEAHESILLTKEQGHASIRRVLDQAQYFVDVNQSSGELLEVNKHEFILSPVINENTFSFAVGFSENPPKSSNLAFAEAKSSSESTWNDFWMSGGAIDFSGCTDPRANEIERRVVLSQYLTRLQCVSQYPPQETGLTMNSWYGKFHLEMHWWHAAHFSQWGRPELLEPSMQWYQDHLEDAKAFASWQGYEGARWMKMTDPWAAESPSGVGAFIIWQQPHPIYFSEQVYKANMSQETLEKYKDIVFETATFLASFAQYSEEDQTYHLCHPIIPAQEIFHATKTNDPPFEMAYWNFALKIAQQWRSRLGLEPNPKWQAVIDQLAPIPSDSTYYLPAAYALDAYSNRENRRDHPMVVGTYGLIPAEDVIDPEKMLATYDEVMKDWQWETTWGWDYPMLAMAAARLGQPEKAVEALLLDVQKNTYLKNGHNYQNERLRLYLPGNGGTLSAVAMMVAGWEGCTAELPGFPKDGKWDIKYENLAPML